MLDDADVRVLWDRLVSAVNEASRILQRSAFSTLVRECNDFACTLMTREGEMLAIADVALPSFASTQALTLRTCLEQRPADDWHEGDIVITNDPWIATGHVMDLTILKPIVFEDRVVAFTGSVAHSPDLGGVQGWNAGADVYEEGLQIPPLQLYRRGVPDETLFALLRANSRTPEQTIGDLMAQIASNETTERRVLQIMREHALGSLDEIAAEIIGRSEAAMRAAIAAIPDGRYEYVLKADGFSGGDATDGADPVPLEFTTAIAVRDSEVEVDLTEASPQVPASINSLHGFTFSYVVYALRLLLVPQVPQNGGFLRPIGVKTRPGTILDARFPAPTLNRTIVGHLVCDGVFGALSGVLPDRVWAMSGSTPIWVLILFGDDGGRRFNRIILLNGGLGANEGTDGEVGSFPANLSNAAVEVVEASTPVMYECKELIPDSGGPGRYRGGFGVRVAIRPACRTAYSIAFNRVRFPPLGLLGGLDGSRGRVLVDGSEIEPGSEGVLEAGSRLVIETPGGGGLGSPAERDRERVTRDVAEGLVSAEQARVRYSLE
jgi:N-methylhydantoinase B